MTDKFLLTLSAIGMFLILFLLSNLNKIFGDSK